MINLSWKRLSMIFLVVNIVLMIQMSNYIHRECISFDNSKPNINGPHPTHKSLLNVIIIDFESFYNTLNYTITTICERISNVKVLIISSSAIYPPVPLYNQTNCAIINVIMNDDPYTPIHYADPFVHINSANVLVVPDATIFTKDSSLIHLKFSLLSDSKILAIPIIEENVHQSYSCLELEFNRREWTLSYNHRQIDESGCDALKGDFAYLIKTSTLRQLRSPFLKPFPLSMFIQNKIHGITVSVDQDIRLAKYPAYALDGHIRWKLDTHHKSNVKTLFRKFGIKRIISDADGTQWFGCSKSTPRCFGTVHNNTPEYLLEGKWTPPCCLQALCRTARHVFAVLERNNVRYWLEGGSLLGAVRTGTIIPWDYDVDIGIYQTDIKNSQILTQALKSPIKDSDGFIWERASEGDFLRVQYSEINRLHVDIFPFKSINGIMTKKTWFPDHPQDREFPEHFLQPLVKVSFCDYQASAPNEMKKFLEFKFGPRVIERPEYPNPSLISYQKLDFY